MTTHPDKSASAALKSLFFMVLVSCGVFGQSGPPPITVGQVIKFRSSSLAEDRELRVYLPASYATGSRRYPVVYTFDGEGTAQIAASAVSFMYGYSAIPRMPEAIVVGITNANRNRDMPIPDGYGKAGESNFLAFLADEVIPMVDKNYRTEPLRVLLGHSQGGLFAHYAMAERTGMFRWIVALDAPVAGFPSIRPLVQKIVNIKGSGNASLRIVSIENLYGWRNEWAGLSRNARPGFEVTQLPLKDETHETMAYKGVYEGLKRLFHDYAPNLVTERRVYTLPELQKRYEDVSVAYGYKVEIPNQLLLSATDHNIAIQHGEEALALVRYAISVYGRSAGADRRLNEAEAAKRKGRDARLEEWAATPLPAPDSLKPFFGIWERKDDATWLIAFATEDGKAKVENTVIPPTFEPFHLYVQFVKVLGPKSIQWGERNGRGPGVTVYTATLTDGETLEGSAEGFGFIRTPPPFTFKYKKRTLLTGKQDDRP